MEDFIERRTGGSGVEVRHARILEKLDDVQFAITEGAKKNIPASIATLLAIDPAQLQAMSGLASTISPDTLASDLAALTTPAT